MRTSCFLHNLKLFSNLRIRWNSSSAKFKLKDEIEKMIVEDQIKPRKHPGIIKKKQFEMPSWLLEAMEQSLEDITDRSELHKNSLVLSNYLFSRRLPPEQKEIKKMYFYIESKILTDDISQLTDEEVSEKRKAVKEKVVKQLKAKMFAWKPIEYNNYRSLMYMTVRSPAEYAVIYSILKEIHVRDPTFAPQNLFDFGSGVGSVLWAANRTWGNIKEYLAVDISNDMNDLSQKIINLSKYKNNIFYRQYLPLSNLRYDLVVSAYSLMELPDIKNRLAVLLKLWRKTNEYLVIVEQGTNAGFQLINEAREFIKHISKTISKQPPYFIFAPCPHNLRCPRFEEGKTPCNFLVQYLSPPLFAPSIPKHELYSYVIFKKGEASENDDWARIVRPVLDRSKHIRCRLCTSDGKLEEVVVTTSKYGKPLYKCAKASNWGDRLPIQPNLQFKSKNAVTEEQIDNESNNEETDSEYETENEKETFVSEAPFSDKTNDKL